MTCCPVGGVAQAIAGRLFHFLLPLAVPGLGQQFGNEELFRPWSGWTSTYMD
jgi:hypothetical protein